MNANYEYLKKIENLTKEDLASITDHTYLKTPQQLAAQAKEEYDISGAMLYEMQLEDFLITAKEFNPYALCVEHKYIHLLKEYLPKNFNPILAATVGYPDGDNVTRKQLQQETELAVEHGAKEVDMVLGYQRVMGYLAGDKSQYKILVDLVRSCQDIAKDYSHGNMVKLIFETSELTEDGIKLACDIANETEVDFIKTSTGYSSFGADVKSLEIMRHYFDGGIKASGGIKTQDQAQKFLTAMSGREDGYISLNPNYVRIGASQDFLKSMFD